jgi:hypothetical protein
MRTTMKITSNLVAAALAGISLGAIGCANDPQPQSPTNASAGAKHSCKGQNACKGQGNCKTDANSCKGQNACKGQGGCHG